MENNMAEENPQIGVADLEAVVHVNQINSHELIIL